MPLASLGSAPRACLSLRVSHSRRRSATAVSKGESGRVLLLPPISLWRDTNKGSVDCARMRQWQWPQWQPQWQRPFSLLCQSQSVCTEATHLGDSRSRRTPPNCRPRLTCRSPLWSVPLSQSTVGVSRAVSVGAHRGRAPRCPLLPMALEAREEGELHLSAWMRTEMEPTASASKGMAADNVPLCPLCVGASVAVASQTVSVPRSHAERRLGASATSVSEGGSGRAERRSRSR